ncbi:MAG: Rhomboid protease GlpG [candidate division WS2 bacterium]|uniref:Rhomboid protease GlpG n=1 Tax=Psychracetigena formicireducens TaxID=2986056 RepID=A0A9E2BHA8_PSYF1|nr:Rhomboid protease GlpG [Candidatus Psychracetigena formicireducens]MBT9144892.1 Rhomboid protease GlpG [Candidatus Psychracetigena formicireducens]MBT9149874.1 Rhomboid protease GlpG [Candidatus Psychracetigena formicireducens]
MIPLKDNIKAKTFCIFNVALILSNITVYLLMLSLSSKEYMTVVMQYGFIPSSFSLPNLFSAMFIHGGFMHLLGNMLFLWIFGDNVEDRLGHLNFIIMYLTAGVVATLTHAVLDLNSNIPLIGASGAISGVIGSYFVLYPGAKILTLVPLGLFITVVALPAYIFLGIWFIIQLIYGFTALGAISEGGVAWWAHVGGFVVGYIWALPIKNSQRR